MTTSYAGQTGHKTSGETRKFSVDFGSTSAPQTGKLDTGELLTGTPTIVQLSSDPTTATALTLANKLVSTGALTINGRSCAAGEAVTFTAAAGDDGAEYVVKITVSTNAATAQTLVGYVRIAVSDS